MEGTKARKKNPPLLSDDRNTIRGWLTSFTCSSSWTESILDLLEKRDRRGKPVIRYQLDSRGRLKTKKAKMLELIAGAMIYPPACDDPGSRMRPCFCRQCTNPSREGVARHVHWPAHYMVKDHLSYTCAVNQAELDADELAAIDPAAELLCEMRRGRVVMPGAASGATGLDPDAWRTDKLDRLPWTATFYPWYCSPDHPEHEDLLPDIIDSFVDRLRKHKWTQVVGEASEDSAGRRSSTVRKQSRGLCNLGSISDFLELGHSLTATGLSAEVAAAIAAMLADYPREPRVRQVRFKWQATRVGKAPQRGH